MRSAEFRGGNTDVFTWSARVAVAAISGYQRWLSPLLPSACRFAPTCSEYARLAIVEHGLLRGGWLAVRRVVCCHPFHRGGYDPPPLRPRRD